MEEIEAELVRQFWWLLWIGGYLLHVNTCPHCRKDLK